MNKSVITKKNRMIVFLTIFAIVSLSSIFAQEPKIDNKAVKHVTMELILANFENALCSDNNGVRMGAVEHIGRYNISNLENCLIELLDAETNNKNKETIALSLFQIGSLNSIAALRKTVNETNDSKLKEFCSRLLEKHNEYEKVRTDYFEDLVVNILDTE